MQPTINDDQKVKVDREYYKEHSISRGEIVCFVLDDGRLHVKRVIGLPNETITIKNGTIYINDKEISSEFIFSQIESFGTDKFVLKENEYFLLGDNAPNSIDSRKFGPKKFDDILGKVIVENGR
jgi:signal peptidase I